MRGSICIPEENSMKMDDSEVPPVQEILYDWGKRTIHKYQLFQGTI